MTQSAPQPERFFVFFLANVAGGGYICIRKPTNYYSMKKLLLIICTICCSFCSNQSQITSLEHKITQLQTENEKLQKELDKYKYAPSKLLADIKKSYNVSNYTELSRLVNQMREYHPNAQELKQAEEYEKKLTDQILLERQKEIEAQQRAERERLKAVDKLKKKFDDVSGVTWYTNPYFTHYNNRNLCSLYIGQQGNQVWLCLKMSYYGDSWIFFDSAYLSYEGNTYKIPFNEYEDKKSDSDTETWEWITVVVNNDLLQFLQKAIKSDNIKMRLSGKYTKTRDLSKNEKQGLKDVLLAYDVLINEIK